MQRLLALSIALAGMAVVACGSDTSSPAPVSKIVTFSADLRASNEVPANASTASGTFTGKLDTSTNVFTYDITVTGMSANVNNGHIHGPAAAGVNAGTTINFNTLPGASFGAFGATSGTAHGVVTLTAATTITTNAQGTMNGDSLKKLLFAGLTYANIHTTANPGGEIRGQITKQ